MTDERREQLVELLRCAADNGVDGTAHGLNGIFGALCALDHEGDHELEGLAFDAKVAVTHLIVGKEIYRAVLLEAALRVEEGRWP